MAKGENLKGGRRPGAGRKKGVPNKITSDLKAMILGALEKAGGERYLLEQAKKNPTAFMTLVGKTLPLQHTGEGGGPVRARVEVAFVAA